MDTQYSNKYKNRIIQIRNRTKKDRNQNARSKSRDELAQSMPCKEEEDEVKVSLDKKIQTVNLTDGVFG